MDKVAIIGVNSPATQEIARKVQERRWNTAVLSLADILPSDDLARIGPREENKLRSWLAEVGNLRGLVWAGYVAPQSVEASDHWTRWQVSLDRHLTLAMLALKYANFGPEGSAVIVTSTIASRPGQADLAQHAAMGGLVGLVRASCGEFAPAAVRVNALCADFDRTGPAEIAEAVMYLLSDAARFVTGAELFVDGGSSRWSRQDRFPQE